MCKLISVNDSVTEGWDELVADVKSILYLFPYSRFSDRGDGAVIRALLY